MVAHPNFSTVFYCYECITDWLQRSSGNFTHAPHINGVRLPGSSITYVRQITMSGTLTAGRLPCSSMLFHVNHSAASVADMLAAMRT